MYKHKKVFNSIQEKIINGAWYEGMLLPSESELCKDFNVSRITVRRALKELEDCKLVFKIQGKGTFVKASINDAIEKNSTDDILYQVKCIEIQSSNQKISEVLKLSVNEDEVVHIRKLRYRNGKPEAIINTWYPCMIGEQLSKMDLENNNSIELLAKITDKPVIDILTKLVPYIPNSDEMDVLNIPKQSAHAKLLRVSKNTNNDIVEYLEAIVNSDDLEFSVVSWGKKQDF